MACGHMWKQINGIGICQKCGLIVSKRGEVMFDREYASGIRKKGKGRRKKCGKQKNSTRIIRDT